MSALLLDLDGVLYVGERSIPGAVETVAWLKERMGMRGVLVRTGKFRPADLNQDIEPELVLDSVRDLPEWWARSEGSP